MTTLLLYLLAFLSGFAALVYQVAWSRMLSLTFGSTTLAVSAVVAGFMGGMGIGAWLYHRVAHRTDIPLKGYGLLEIGIALTTALFTLLFIPLPEWFAAASIYVPDGIASNAFRIATACVLLIVPSSLMGATFPALCRSLLHSAEDVDVRLGWIYGLNTLGAAVGALAAGFVMIEMLGSHGSVTMANAINLAVGVIALLLASKEVKGTGSSQATTDESLPSELPTWIAGIVLFGSGFATLGYEIVWFRALRYLMGNGTYVLSTALVIFLTGLGLGGTLYRQATRFGKPEWTLGISQLVVAMLALIAILSEQWVLVHPSINQQVNGMLGTVNDLAWQVRVGIGFAIAVAIMLPATIWMGLAFPLASRLFLGNMKGLTSRVGLAYLISNLGSISGAILAATWILPTMGTIGGTTFLASINVLLGFLILFRAPMMPYRAMGMVMVVMTVLVASQMPERLAFGFYQGSIIVDEQETDLGTVHVLSRGGKANALGMSIDGVVIGGTLKFYPSIYEKQLIITHLPMILDRGIRDTLNLGVASGSTIKTLSRYSWVETLDAVEINPAVIDAGSFFPDTNVLQEPRATLYVEDAVHYLLRTPKTYDLIINDAKQDPRFGGTSKILSHELYQYSLDRLNECGIFVQFLPLVGSPESLQLILRTFISVFPETEFFIESNSYLITTGSRCPIGGRSRPTREELEGLGVASEIEKLFVPDPTQLPAMWLASGSEYEELIGDGPINTWDKLPLEFLSYRMPKQTREQAALVLEMLNTPRHRDPIGKPEFTSDTYFRPLLELVFAREEWLQLEHGAANRRVDRVLEEFPNLPPAHTSKAWVKRQLGE